MKLRIIGVFIVLVLVLSPNCFAQNLVIVNSDSLYHGLENASILKIEKGKADITKYFSDSFIYEPAKPYIMETPNNDWGYIVKLKVENKTSSNLLFYMPFFAIEDIRLYVEDNEGIHTKMKSGFIKLKDKHFKGNCDVFNLNIPKGEAHIVYLYLEGTKLPKQRFFIGSSQKVMNTTHQNNLLFGLYLGLVLVIIVYNLILYFQVREIDHMVYSALVFCFAMIQSDVYGFSSVYLWPSKPWIANYSAITQAITGVVTLIWAIVFLKLKVNAPVLYNICRIFILHAVVSFFLKSFGVTGGFMVLFDPALVAQVVNLFLLVSGIIVLVRGFKPGIYYVLSNFFLMVAVAVFLAFAYDAVPYSFITYNSFAIGSGLEILFFSLALASKVNYYKKDKVKAEKERMAALEETRELISKQNEMLELQVKKRTDELSKEKEKSEKLIQNILPIRTIKELNETGRAIPKNHPWASVFFADVVGFTSISSNMAADKLVNELDKLFTGMDKIIEEFKIEKIKTIGDAYLCVNGLESDNATKSAETLVEAALRIVDFSKRFNKEQAQRGIPPFKLRIGIDSGAVASGVVGTKKYQYDIWGNTVNIASRMESMGAQNKINISKSTYALIKDLHQFDFDPRGSADVKGKGEMEMYFVSAK